MSLDKLYEKLRSKHEWVRELLSEFIGTFVLMFVGLSSVAQSVLSSGRAGAFLSINLGFGFAAALAVLVSGSVSGAHLNPAVSLALVVIKKFPLKKVPHYLLGQYLGSFVASVCVFLVYYDALNAYDGGERSVVGLTGTAGVWTTYPSHFLSLSIAFVDQVMGTFILLLAVCAVTDLKNMKVHTGLYALYVGITVAAIGLSLGFNCGYAINPARDLSPRIFVTIAGWGTEAFTYGDFWWVPILGPHIGGILGAVVYKILIDVQLSETSAELS